MKNFLFGIFLLTAVSLSAQEDLFPGNGLYKDEMKGNINAYSLSNTLGDSPLEIDDENLHIPGYKGSPLLLYEWADAAALFNDGKLVNISLVNYDALSDQFVVYVPDVKEEIEGMLTKKFPLVALDKKNLIAVALKNKDEFKKFVKVSPLRFKNKSKTDFFEYFASAPKDAYVLKSYYKKVGQNRLNAVPYSDSHETYAFKTYTRYFIRNKDKLFVATALGKKNVLRALGDSSQEKALKSYIKKNKLKMSHPEDVQRLLEYYFKELK